MVIWFSAGDGVGFPTPTPWEIQPPRGLTSADGCRGGLRDGGEPAVISRQQRQQKPSRHQQEHHCVRQPKPKVVIQQSDLRDEQFQRLSVLGEGSYSVVVAARHLPSRQVVALKELSRQRLRDAKLETQLQWEINLHRTLRHPNIVRLLSYYITPRSVVLVLELCRGGSLLRRLQATAERRFDEGRATRYIRHVAQALAYLHEHGIVHRDLKPGNILVDARGVARLADFGWSKGLAGSAAAAVITNGYDASEVAPRCAAGETDACSETEDGHGRLTVCGTLDYMPPELLGGTPCSYKADMWSLGALLVEILSGQPPFYRTSQQETLQAIQDEGPQLDVDGSVLSPLARDLALQLLQKDPNVRPTAAEVLQHPWLRGKRPRV
ncbi:serine/threonine-protein kinase [Trypanosoma brucei equiperdum]|nr:serine/threonine-protein kinase [Trypanosoma brucei equiperdum]